MATDLSMLAQQFILDEERARRVLTYPVLVWEAGATGEEEADDRVLLATRAGLAARRPRQGEPLVYEVKKGTNKANAFAMGVTIGRTETNDIAVDDESVSRFHGWMAQDARGWKLVDAESKNGTWLGALKLQPNRPEILQDGQRIRFGNVEMVFLLPASFEQYVKQMMSR